MLLDETSTQDVCTICVITHSLYRWVEPFISNQSLLKNNKLYRLPCGSTAVTMSLFMRKLIADILSVLLVQYSIYKIGLSR